jgi:hypothetical protein
MSDFVTKDILDVFDKYEGDFGLLDEPWASKRDREKVSVKQSMILGEYVDKLILLKVENISHKLRESTMARIIELERSIDAQVVTIVRGRMGYRSSG